jgi:hypothetical protein
MGVRRFEQEGLLHFPSLPWSTKNCIFIDFSVVDSSNAVLGETFTPPPKKGNQTFVLREMNFALHRKQNKKAVKSSVKSCKK